MLVCLAAANSTAVVATIKVICHHDGLGRTLLTFYPFGSDFQSFGETREIRKVQVLAGAWKALAVARRARWPRIMTLEN